MYLSRTKPLAGGFILSAIRHNHAVGCIHFTTHRTTPAEHRDCCVGSVDRSLGDSR
jgi:hypothetical protein